MRKSGVAPAARLQRYASPTVHVSPGFCKQQAHQRGGPAPRSHRPGSSWVRNGVCAQMHATSGGGVCLSHPCARRAPSRPAQPARARVLQHAAGTLEARTAVDDGRKRGALSRRSRSALTARKPVPGDGVEKVAHQVVRTGQDG